MQINKHGSFYIRNGWPTKIIDAMDPQDRNSYIFSPNNELAAVDQIGVGRVMVKALRYWAAVLGITIESKTQQGVLHTLSSFGEMVAQYDPYCQRAGTLWFLHRNLSRNIHSKCRNLMSISTSAFRSSWCWRERRKPVRSMSGCSR